MKSVEKPRTYQKVVAITVDMQNDFVLPTGALSVTQAEETIPAVNAVNEFVRENKGHVIFTQDWHRPDNEAHFAKWPVHCVQNRAGAALHDNVFVSSYDSIAQKGMYLEDDGYSGWGAELKPGVLHDLVGQLPSEQRTVGRAIGILARITAERGGRTAVLIDGVATDYCDLATSLDALAESDPASTDIFIVADGMRAVDLQPGDGDAAIAKMLASGAHHITSKEIVNGSIVVDRSRLER